MPRKLRVLLDGGLYHVYSRTARGDAVFSNEREADAFLDLLREVKVRDDWTVFAWCLMSNHYHLALRTAEVPLSRSMHLLQGKFAQDHNRRHGFFGPLWQGRFKARLVESQRYLDQVVIYIHLNPVTAGAVTDPAAYPRSGHRELLGEVEDPFIDVDAALQGFGDTVDEARRSYVRRLRGAGEEEWVGEEPALLPWWKESQDRPLQPPTGGPHVDLLGRSTARERPRLSAMEFVARAGAVLGVDPDRLASRFRDEESVRVRELVATLGIERYDLRAKDLAAVLSRHPDWVSRLASRGANRRSVDSKYRAALEDLDERLSGTAARVPEVPEETVVAPPSSSKSLSEEAPSPPRGWATWL